MTKMNKHYHTKKCIKCTSDAMVWTGHVHNSDEGIVTAGWCKICHEISSCKLNKDGPCYGRYDKELEEDQD